MLICEEKHEYKEVGVIRDMILHVAVLSGSSTPSVYACLILFLEADQSLGVWPQRSLNVKSLFGYLSKLNLLTVSPTTTSTTTTTTTTSTHITTSPTKNLTQIYLDRSQPTYQTQITTPDKTGRRSAYT